MASDFKGLQLLCVTRVLGTRDAAMNRASAAL